MKKMEIDYDELDPGIVNVVRILNDNGMQPIASCDGTYKSHVKNGKYDHQLGYLRLLDTDNYNEKTLPVLETVLHELLDGKRPEEMKRRKIDQVFETVEALHNVRGINAEIVLNDFFRKETSDENYACYIADSNSRDLTDILGKNDILSEDWSASIDSRGVSYRIYSDRLEAILGVAKVIGENQFQLKKMHRNSGELKNRKIKIASNREVEEYIESINNENLFTSYTLSYDDLLDILNNAPEDSSNENTTNIDTDDDFGEF